MNQDTQCTHDGKLLKSFPSAAIHVAKHTPVRHVESKAKWGPGTYVDGELWSAYASRTDPPSRAQQAAKTTPDSASQPVDEYRHSRLGFDDTDCLEDEHYPKIPAWQMTEKGKGVGPHRHKDVDNHCLVCGAESDRTGRFDVPGS